MGLQNSSTVGIAHSKIREHKVIEHWTAQYKNTLRRICPKNLWVVMNQSFLIGGKQDTYINNPFRKILITKSQALY